MKKVILIISIVLVCFLFFFLKPKGKKKIKDLSKDIKSHYSEQVKTGTNVKVYDDKENVIGEVSNVFLKLKKQKITSKTKYFYAENIEGYVYYKDVEKVDDLVINKLPEQYVPFNVDVTLNKNASINVDDKSYYKFDKEITFNPVKIDDGKYYFTFDNSLVYVNESDIKDKKDINKYDSTSAIAVVNYHYVINVDAGEKKDCQQSICLTDSQYDEQMKYLKDNGYYTASMEDLELWIDGKVNLPLKTVVITIDDGWFVSRNIQILEKYGLHATLFLIGHLASPDDYRSNSLEIHSHTWDMHNLGECPIKRGGAILCKDKDYILNDLKKSRDSLNGSLYFAYPFYEYNDHAIEALKEAGFHMAFAGGSRKVTRGVNKFIVPRFGITNTGSLNEFISYIS